MIISGSAQQRAAQITNNLTIMFRLFGEISSVKKKRVELEKEQARRPQIEVRRLTNGVCGLERDNDIGTSN